jgi:DNA repair protein RadD
MITLRDYQRDAIDAVYDAFRGGMQRPLVVMPTGSGKSPTIAILIQEALTLWPDQRILMLVDSQELVAQNYKQLLRAWPQAPVTVYAAGLNMRDLRGQVLYGSIQSLWNKAADIQRCDLIIVDEAHMMQPSGDGRYRKLLADLKEINGRDIPVVGFTATPFRLNSGSLIDGKGRVFDDIAFEVPFGELLARGFVVKPTTKGTDTTLDLRGVHTRGGEYVESELQKAVDREEVTRAACAEIALKAANRVCWLIFSTGVEHANHIADTLFHNHGILGAVISAKTPKRERAHLIKAHQEGRIRVLINDSVLTKGYDNPRVDMIAVLRPTQSAGLWVQIIGRGTRPCPAICKKDCLILDFGRNALRHGPIDKIKGKVKKDKEVRRSEEDGLSKQCPQCNSVIDSEFEICPDCGYMWPRVIRQRQFHDSQAVDAPLLSDEAEMISSWLPVTNVGYSIHRKKGSPPMLRVEYCCGLMRYMEWVFFEHDGLPRRKAESWWKMRDTVDGVIPDTTEDALSRSTLLNRPTAIRVRPSGKYFNVVQVRFREPQVEKLAA